VPFSVIIVSVPFLTPAIVGLLSESARLARQLFERGLGSGMPKRAIKESTEALSETSDCGGVVAITGGLGIGILGRGSFGGGLGGASG
jgi:hypothetical protein